MAGWGEARGPEPVPTWHEFAAGPTEDGAPPVVVRVPIVRRRHVPSRAWCGAPVELADGSTTGCQLRPDHVGGSAHAAGFTEDGVLLDYPIRQQAEPIGVGRKPPFARLDDLLTGRQTRIEIDTATLLRLDLRPGEVLVLRCPPTWTFEDARVMREIVLDYLGANGIENDVVSIPAEVGLEVLRATDVAYAVEDPRGAPPGLRPPPPIEPERTTKG